jgi:omega-hydroxy-beta-dihydromenaquinone-9 sulfotransferase
MKNGRGPAVTGLALQGMGIGAFWRVLRRNQFRVDPPYAGRLAHLLLMGLLNSVLAARERRRYGSDIARTRVEQPPLFILGHQRSGTTHLHNLLSLDDRADTIRVYQAMFPLHFCYSQKIGRPLFNWLAPKRRPMDNIAFNATAPHEDEFALACLSTVSPYMRFLFPVTGDLPYSECDPSRLPESAREEWRDAFVYCLKKLYFWKQQKRILFKSPPHMGRIPILLKLCPGARFVHIVRHPYEVYRSTRDLWRNTLVRSHLQQPEEKAIDEQVLADYTELSRLYERDKALIPAGSLHELKYEDLVTRPLASLEGLYEGLNLPCFRAFREKAGVFLDSIKDYRTNEHRMTNLERETVRARWGATFARYGYAE